jgi:hypothetical protein
VNSAKVPLIDSVATKFFEADAIRISFLILLYFHFMFPENATMLGVVFNGDTKMKLKYSKQLTIFLLYAHYSSPTIAYSL